LLDDDDHGRRFGWRWPHWCSARQQNWARLGPTRPELAVDQMSLIVRTEQRETEPRPHNVRDLRKISPPEREGVLRFFGRDRLPPASPGTIFLRQHEAADVDVVPSPWERAFLCETIGCGRGLLAFLMSRAILIRLRVSVCAVRVQQAEAQPVPSDPSFPRVVAPPQCETYRRSSRR